MKDASLKLREEYYRLLNGNITLNGNVVPVYDVPTSSASYPYILINTFTELTEDDKDSFGIEGTQTIDIVTGYSNGNYGGKKDSDLIANQLKNLIKTSKVIDNFDMSPNFRNIVTRLERSNTITEQTPNEYIIRRILDFRHVIQELN